MQCYFIWCHGSHFYWVEEIRVPGETTFILFYSYVGIFGEKIDITKKVGKLTAGYWVVVHIHVCVLQGPAVYCPLCEKEGHLKHSCPEELLPELVPIPKMTKPHKEMLSTLLKRIPSKIRSFGRKSVNYKLISHTHNQRSLWAAPSHHSRAKIWYGPLKNYVCASRVYYCHVWPIQLYIVRR